MKLGMIKKLKNIRSKSLPDNIETTYSEFLMGLIGIDDKPQKDVSNEQIDLVVKARAIFIEASSKAKKLPEKGKTDDLDTGGETSILEIIEVTTSSIIKDKELCESFIPKIQPIQRDIEIEPSKYLLTFSLMKICHKIGKLYNRITI
jgi:hypothetical protein